MRVRSGVIVLCASALVTLAGPVWAQQAHAIPSSQIDRTLTTRVTAASADRAALLRLLDRPETRSVAGRYGVDLERARDAVGTLDGPELARLGSRARDLNAALAGGSDTIVISTTTLIIALLVLIIILVA